MEGITVSDAYEVLRDDGIVWKAGKSGESNIINAVTVLEILNCMEWILGGEMILTTLNVCKSEKDKLDLIRDLRNGGAACVIVHPGNKEELININNIVSYADSIGFPLFLAERKVPYSLIIKKIYENLLNKEENALKKAQQINSMMNNILISDYKGVSKIIEKLSSIVGKNVVLLDDFMNVIAEKYNSEGKEITDENKKKIFEYIKTCLYNTFYMQNVSNDIKIINFDEQYDIMIIPININKNFYRYLIIFKYGKISDKEKEFIHVALPGTISALKVDMLTTQAILDTEQRLKSDFFYDIVNERHTSNELMLRRARTLGLNLLEKNFLVVVDLDDFENYYKENYTKGECHFQRIKRDLKKSVEQAFRVAKMERRVAFFVQQSDACILVVGFTYKEYKTGIYKNIIDTISNNIIKIFDEKNADISVTISISSDFSSLNDTNNAFNQALFAKDIGKKLFNSKKILYYDDMGIYKYVSFENKDDILTHHPLRALYALDEDDKLSLLETLEVFLDNYPSIKTTAEKLYIHPNTVKYRIKKIKDVVGAQILDDPQARLQCHLLLKILKASRF
ncbi:helix-turn-helix domain-containing protein [Acetomicrobium sp. UBA5826]|uniref:helix-turn-helix domain-containing protein n=1 Tax=Acetomicrobium sp. UBA5826 TaxID=1946039 RepID=UPI00257D4E8B|nr:helix-turn-helix domain-containing protein [Acetomicrobium sp. UBA5826]